MQHPSIFDIWGTTANQLDTVTARALVKQQAPVLDGV
jgi:hypothetical protein